RLSGVAVAGRLMPSFLARQTAPWGDRGSRARARVVFPARWGSPPRGMSYPFDLGNPATNANPFPEFARLRAEDPVHWSAAMKAWIVTRYADVRQVALNNRQISADRLTPFFKTNSE